MFRDINGEGVDTDYKLISTGEDKGKVVRVDPNDGTDNDKTDRIYDTNKKGEKTSLIVGDVKKGIIEEGMNMRNNYTFFNVGGVNQPTVDDVVDFMNRFAEGLNKEISGFEGTAIGNNDQMVIVSEPYKDNSQGKSRTAIVGYGKNFVTSGGSIFIEAHFHTHPSNTRTGDLYIDGGTEYDTDDIRNKADRIKAGNHDMKHYIYNKNGRKPY